MDEKKKSEAGTRESLYQKRERSYIRSATKAATHPIRAQILKGLKEREMSTPDLEALTGEARYNLYHHLNALEQVGLVGWTMRDNKTKLYHAEAPQNPEAAVIIISEEDIRIKRELFAALLDVLSAIEDKPVPHPEKIRNAEICLYYETDTKD